MESKIYQTRVKKFKGHDYRTVYKQTFSLYKNIASRTKRKPYIRSKYFKKEKIFLDYFWSHLHDKNTGDKTRRLKFYACALDLIVHNSIEPISSKQNPNKLSEKLYRFSGITDSKDKFIVQIKELKNGQKYFLSVFPD